MLSRAAYLSSMQRGAHGALLMGQSAALLEQRRAVQFRKTSDMNTALNSGRKSAEKWVTKSTADYAAKTDDAIEAGVVGGDAQRKREVKARKVAADRRAQELQAWQESQVGRMEDFQAARRRRYASFSLRFGWTFILVYVVVYVAMLGFLWALLRSGAIDMLSIFEATYCFISGHLDRPSFFERLEEWGDYTNLGFAFMLNELMDVIRVPVALGLWWMFRRALIRMKTNSVFRWNSVEYDIELRRVQRACDEAGRKAEDAMRKKELEKSLGNKKLKA
jgi:hypothetical protein